MYDGVEGLESLLIEWSIEVDQHFHVDRGSSRVSELLVGCHEFFRLRREVCQYKWRQINQ